jgi:hypothetical protein
MSPFIKFSSMNSFLMLVLTNYEKWYGDKSNNFILQTKQKK